MNKECKPFSDLPAESEGTLIAYHASIGHEHVSEVMRGWRGSIALLYHNITPSNFFEGVSSRLAADLKLGREDLVALMDRTVVAVADSEFNASELREIGYPEVHVVAAGFDASRLRRRTLMPWILGEMMERFPNGYILVVGQLLPHKRIDQAISAVHLLNSTYWLGVGLVICGTSPVEPYAAAIKTFARTCQMVDVHFAGHVTDDELATYMVRARALLTMSEHEGMCFPPVESAAVGVPVIAKASGALPETIGNAAILLPVKSGPELACEALRLVLEDAQIRGKKINEGYQRAAEIQNGIDSASAAFLLLNACK
jgi:glycosyltransferase involved in cell wall biosynthesis